MPDEVVIKKEFVIENMDCADCANHLEQVIGKIKGINTVSVNFVNGRMQLSGKEHALADQQIIQTVQRAGYLAKIEPPGAPFDLKPESSSRAHGQTENRFGSFLILIFCAALVLTGGIFNHLFAGRWYAIPFILSGIILGGVPIARKGWQEAKLFKPGMNLLMSVAVIGAAAIGEWTEAGVVVVLFALAQYLEVRSLERARRSINALMDENPLTARLVTDDGFQIVPAASVQPGQKVAVKPGEKIPSDGILIEGSAYINQAAITGEPLPVLKRPDDRVFAGTINTDGFLVIMVDKIYSDTTISRIIHLVTEAQSKKAPKQAFIDRFAGYYTPAVIFLALMVAVLPPILLNQPFIDWFYRALVLLVISCPCALVISTPVTIVSGLTAAVRKGVLIKGGLFLEDFSRLKAIAFDKTGTLTEGKPAVQDITLVQGHSKDEVLTIAASLEVLSGHPIAGAIVEKARERKLRLKPVTGYRNIDGKGVEGQIGEKKYIIGNHRLFEEKGWCDEKIHHLLEKVEDEKHTAVLVGNSDTILAIIAINDILRNESRRTISGLKSAGIGKIVLLTGDNHRTAQKVAEAVGLSDHKSELLPEDKVTYIRALKSEFGGVAMVGDGFNDAPSLAEADIGIAMGNSSVDAALDTADIVLMKDDLSKLTYLWQLSRLSNKIIRQNIILALGLKFIFLVLAVPGLATLWMAVIADMGASLLVIFNGFRTLRQ